jgi:hypothetical protein
MDKKKLERLERKVLFQREARDDRYEKESQRREPARAQAWLSAMREQKGAVGYNQESTSL